MREHPSLCDRGRRPFVYSHWRLVTGTRPVLKVRVCVYVYRCVFVCVWKWDRVGMMTDGNVIHPLIINMPHLYSA